MALKAATILLDRISSRSHMQFYYSAINYLISEIRRHFFVQQ